MRYTWHYDSPLGGMTMASDGSALTGLWFDGQKYFPEGLVPAAAEEPDKGLPTGAIHVFRETERWLDLYFSGQRPAFTPPLAARGTDFQEAVWKMLRAIPYGETITYGALAARLSETDRKGSAQAVGGAVGHNPISLIIPCHRVIGADGSLTGYAGGLERKEWLLAHEKQNRDRGGTDSHE